MVPDRIAVQYAAAIASDPDVVSFALFHPPNKHVILFQTFNH